MLYIETIWYVKEKFYKSVFDTVFRIYDSLFDNLLKYSILKSE